MRLSRLSVLSVARPELCLLYEHVARWKQPTKHSMGLLAKGIATAYQNPSPSPAQLQDEATIRHYRSLVGKIAWLSANTRPDLAYCANFLARWMATPTVEALDLAERAMAYVKGTPDLGLIVPPPSEVQRLVGFSDATWGNVRDGGRSQTGWLVGVESKAGKFYPLMWKSALQKRTAKSSCEAELYSLESMSMALVHLKNQLCEMGLPALPCVCRTDAKDVVDLLSPQTLTQSRNLLMRTLVRVVRERVVEHSLEVVHIPREKNYADELTKPTRGVVVRGLLSKC